MTEPEDMRRFLQDPGTPPRRTPEQRAFADVSDMFAREAVLALRQYEQSLGDDAPAGQLAERFGRLWRDAGLDQVDWSRGNNSDAERILVAAAELADSPGTPLSVQAATTRAAQVAPVNDTAARIQTDVDRAYGHNFKNQEPSAWMEQSLGRLARARVLQDVAALGTRVEPSPELIKAGNDVVDRALDHADQRRDTDRTALDAARAGARRDQWLGAWGAYHAAATAWTFAGGQWSVAAGTSFSMLMTTVLARRGQAATTANNRLAGSQRAMTGQRDAVAGAVDRVPRPTRPDGGVGR